MTHLLLRVRLSATLLCLVMSTAAFAQTTRVQFLHNAPDPALQLVDVYLDGSLALNDFSFRTATPYLDVPADVSVSIAIAPSNSTGVADAAVTFDRKFTFGRSHFVMVAGVLDPSGFAPNPVGESTAVRLVHTPNARETSTRPPDLQLFFAHGAPDAPIAGIRFGADEALLDGRGINFSGATGHGAFAPAVQSVSLVAGPGLREAVASYSADLTTLEGQAGALVASGFLDPAANRDGPALTLLAVFPDGTVIDLETGPLPRVLVRIIHGSADPLLEEIDVRLKRQSAAGKTNDPQEEDLYIGKLGKGSGRSLSLSSGTYDATISTPGIASSKNAEATAPIVVLRDLVFQEGDSYAVLLAGVTDATKFAANPEGRATKLTAVIAGGGRDAANDPQKVDVRIAHLITDMQTVDVYAKQAGQDSVYLARGLGFGTVSEDYVALEPGKYTIRAIQADRSDEPELVINAFDVDLNAQVGKAVVLPLYGFADPARNGNGQPPRAFAWNPDATVPAARQAVLTLTHAAASVETVNVLFEPAPSGKTSDPNQEDLYIGKLSKGSGRSASLSVGTYTVTVTESTDEAGKAAAQLAEFEAMIEEDKTYDFILADPVEAGGQAVELVVDDNARSILVNSNEPEVSFVNLMADVDTIDVLASRQRSIEVLAASLGRGDFSDYVSLQPGNWRFYVTVAGDPTNVVLTFDHVVVPGRGSPERIPIIGSREKPQVVDNEEEVPRDRADRFMIHGNYPNPFAGKSHLLLDLPESGRARLEVFDLTGRRVAPASERWLPAGARQRLEIDATSLPAGLYLYQVAVDGETNSFRGFGRFVVTR